MKDNSVAKFWRRLRRVLRECLQKKFPNIFSSAKKPQAEGPSPELADRPKPYDEANPPADLAAAQERLGFLKRRKRDWFARGMRRAYEKMAQISAAAYADRKNDFRGTVNAVMRADIEERRFLTAWLAARQVAGSVVRGWRRAPRPDRKPPRPPGQNAGRRTLGRERLAARETRGPRGARKRGPKS